MAAKVETKIKEAFVQYSKKMCTRVTIFWMVYRLANFAVMLLRPELTSALTELCAGVDTVMIVNMSAYTGNSATEKVAIAWAKRGQRTGDSEDDSENSEDEETDSAENG